MATRSLGQRLGGYARDKYYRLVSIAERVGARRGGAELPPVHLRVYYYGTPDPDAFVRHCTGTSAELLTRGLQPEHRVLDIGSGIGNLAIGLSGYLRGGYDGVEIHPEAVAWCQRAITPRHPQFRFHRADLASRAYNPRGTVRAAQYRFPFPDRTFDFVFLASVFTHLLPDAVTQYVHEIARLLTPGGKCVVSFFLINDETRPGIDAGRSFMSFGVRDASGHCRLHDAAVPESAVAFEETFVRRLVEDAGLRIEEIRRGRWWTGEAHDQDIVTLVPATPQG